MKKFLATLLLLLLILALWPLQSLSRSFSETALDTAATYVGEKETRANRSKNIDRFNKTAGAPPGSYWCMAFVYYCVQVAADALDLINPLLKTASVSQQLRYANNIGSGLQVIPVSKTGGSLLSLLPGDIFCMKSGGGTVKDIGRLWPGHTGFIHSPSEKTGEYNTIEGNTNAVGSRNGNQVAERKRKITDFLAIIRIV